MFSYNSYLSRALSLITTLIRCPLCNFFMIGTKPPSRLIWIWIPMWLCMLYRYRFPHDKLKQRRASFFSSPFVLCKTDALPIEEISGINQTFSVGSLNLRSFVIFIYHLWVFLKKFKAICRLVPCLVRYLIWAYSVGSSYSLHFCNLPPTE